MTTPVVHLRPATAPVPLVFDSPHSGRTYPEDFRFAAPFALIRKSEDTHVDDLYAAAPEHGAALIHATFPRIYIDPNRALEDMDQGLLDAPWPGPVASGEKTRLGIGLVWRLAQPGVPVYDRKLSVAELQARIDRYWRPYHDTLTAALDEAHGRFGAVWHINCHSMGAVGTSMSPDPGRRRADFVLGDRDGTSCAPEFTAAVRDFFRAKGYSVAVNDPYKGVEIVRKFGVPAKRRHSLQIEINRDRYMHEDSLERNANYPKLKADLSELIAYLAAWTRAAI